MLRLKAKELSSDPEFKASIYRVVQQLETSPRCIYESENNFGAAFTSRHGGEDSRIPCDLSFQPQEPSNSRATEQCRSCCAVETSRVAKLSLQLKPTEKNYRRKSFSKAFVSCESRYHQECRYTRKAGWMKKVFFFPCLFIFQSKSYSARGFSELWHHSYHVSKARGL